MIDKSLNALDKKNPRLASIIRNTNLNGEYLLTNTKNEHGYPSLVHAASGKNFYDNIDPYDVALKDIQKKQIKLGEFFIVLGLGLGYEVDIILANFPNARVVIIEADPKVLITNFSIRDYSKLINNENILFVGCEDLYSSYPLMFKFFSQNNNIVYLRAINFIEQPISFTLNKEFYLNSIKFLKELITNCIYDYGNAPQDSLLGIQNVMRNIPIIIQNPGIKDLKDKFKNKPGIVVSAGPSLDKNIHLLKGLRDKAVICAADGAVKIMKHYDVDKPHFIASLERGEETAILFKDLSEEDLNESYFAACPVIHPYTYDSCKAKNIITYRRFELFKWLDIEKGILDVGPSAGNMAYSILEYLGCNPIILIGQDLAYKDDLTSHAKGFVTGENNITEQDKKELIRVEGNYQDEVITHPIYNMFKFSFEKSLKNYKGKCINATEGGAKIHGAELDTFEDAINKYINKSFDIDSMITKNLSEIKYEQKLKEINSTIEKLEKGIQFCYNFNSNLINSLNKYSEEILALLQKESVDDIEDVKKLYNLDVELQPTINSYDTEDFKSIAYYYLMSFSLKFIQDINEIRSKYVGFELYKLLLIKKHIFFRETVQLLETLMIEFDVGLKIIKNFKIEFEKES